MRGAPLTEGPVGRHLVRLTVPMIGGLFATMALGATDTFFVAQLGTEELAAMSFTFPVVMVLISLGIGLGAGTSSVLARAVGSGERRRVVRLATDSLVLSSLITIVLAALGIVTIEPLFRLIGADERTLPLIGEYMTIWYVAMIFLVVPMVGGSSLRASGDTLTPSLVMVLAAVLNLILDPLLIFGLAGFPRLELEGAAIATLIARVVSLLITLAVLHFRDRLLTARPAAAKELLASWRQILHVGLPAAATNMIIPAALGVVTALLATYGPVAVAAFGAASRIESMALILFYALSSVIGPFVGQNLGAGLHGRIDRAMRLSYRFCLLLGAVLALLFGLLSTPVASLFSDRSEVIEATVAYLLLVPISYGAYGLVMQANAAFNGLGRPMRAVFISTLRMIALYLPLAYLGSRLWGVPGIFAGGSLANLLGGLVAYRLTFPVRHLATDEIGGSRALVPNEAGTGGGGSG